MANDDRGRYGQPDRDRVSYRPRDRQPEGGWPMEERGGYGGEPGYGYGREGQDRIREDDRRPAYGYGRDGQSWQRDQDRPSYGYGREGSDERSRGALYGYAREGDGIRPGPGVGYGRGPGVGYHGQHDSGYRNGDRGSYGPRTGGYREHDSHNDHEQRGPIARATDEVQSWFGDDDAERRRRMDDQRSGGNAWTASGEHRGRGPRNYTRSDDRVRDDINDRLYDDPHIDASDIEVAVAQGEVTLSGTVRDRFAKRHAEDLAEQISGVKHVQNNLRVQTPGRGFGQPGSANDAGSGRTDAEGGVQTTGIGIPGTMTRSI